MRNVEENCPLSGDERLCHVVLPNDNILEITVKNHNPVLDYLKKVCDFLKIAQIHLFGFKFYNEKLKNHRWINLRNSFHVEIPVLLSMKVHFEVKYYVSPQEILQDSLVQIYYECLRHKIMTFPHFLDIRCDPDEDPAIHRSRITSLASCFFKIEFDEGILEEMRLEEFIIAMKLQEFCGMDWTSSDIRNVVQNLDQMNQCSKVDAMVSFIQISKEMLFYSSDTFEIISAEDSHGNCKRSPYWRKKKSSRKLTNLLINENSITLTTHDPLSSFKLSTVKLNLKYSEIVDVTLATDHLRFKYKRSENNQNVSVECGERLNSNEKTFICKFRHFPDCFAAFRTFIEYYTFFAANRVRQTLLDRKIKNPIHMDPYRSIRHKSSKMFQKVKKVYKWISILPKKIFPKLRERVNLLNSDAPLAPFDTIYLFDLSVTRREAYEYALNNLSLMRSKICCMNSTDCGEKSRECKKQDIALIPDGHMEKSVVQNQIVSFHNEFSHVAPNTRTLNDSANSKSIPENGSNQTFELDGIICDKNSKSGRCNHIDSVCMTESLQNPQNLCSVCIDRNVECVFCPCGHMNSCIRCASRCRSCPVCRSKINCVQRVYF